MKKKMTLGHWIPILKSGQKFYKMADLLKLSGLSYHSCRVTVSRLVKKGLLVKLGKELFGSALVVFTPEEAICQAYFPSYISCEYVLSRHGVMDQMPYVYTVMTTRRNKRTTVGKAEVSYEHLRQNLFWGYVPEGEAFVAEPEKALLDWIYLRREMNLDEVHWEEIDLQKLNSYAKKFPKEVQKKIRGWGQPDAAVRAFPR